LVRVSKHQARALEKREFISYLEQSDLSDARRYFELARCSLRQHDKVELMAGAIVGISLGWLLGGGTWFGSLATGAMALFATLILIFLIHWTRSPSAFHRAAIAERDAALETLSKIQAAVPILAGKINCIALDVHHHPSRPEGLYGDCWFTMNVNVWNDGGSGTNITGFRFLVRWASSGDDWPTRQVAGLNRFRTKSLRPSDPGSEERYTTDTENLFDFPVPSEVSLTNNQDGWLRFVVRDFPLRTGMELDFDTVITLTALDKKGEPHTIYQGPIPGRDCPPIVAVPDPDSESRLEINFDETRAGFVDQTSVLINWNEAPCTIYRVSVVYHGPKSTLADLKAEDVTLTNGRRYPPLHLRITGKDDAEKQARLNPGTPVFWDVVEKVNSDRDWVTLRHTEKEKAILQRTSTTFKITASCDEDLPVTKIVRLGIRDDGNLDFRLFDA
jgi:hypothetical protein